MNKTKRRVRAEEVADEMMTMRLPMSDGIPRADEFNEARGDDSDYRVATL